MDAMDADLMDVDDIILDVDPVTQAEEAQAMRIDETNEGVQNGNGVTQTVPEAYTERLPILEVVNLSGVNQFDPPDPKEYALEHFPSHEPTRVAWVNDGSVNLFYSTAEVSANALIAFSNPAFVDPSSEPAQALRKAKPYSKKPASDLHVRQGNTGDQKKKDAHKESTYYLWNPQHDRHELRTRERERGRGRNGRYRDMDGEEAGDYNRRRFDDREHRRRRNEDQERGFDENMYDDDGGASSRNDTRDSRRDSTEDEGRPRGRADQWRPRRRSAELFDRETSTYGRLRDRSASPGHEGDGRMGFADDDYTIRGSYRQRSATPPRRRYIPRNRSPKELFGGRRDDAPLRELFSGRTEQSVPLSAHDRPRELFGSNISNSRKPREPFPNRTDISNHRRTDATDETAYMKGPKKSLLERMTKNGESLAPKPGLESRITRTVDESSFGRLKDDFSEPSESSFGRLNEGFGDNQPPKRNLASRITRDDEDINIRGTAEQTPGFSIRGAADNFGEKIKGRGGPRRRAADLFG
ncbi:hypothetical protein K469DRAFT_666626 [Zopfia rhizophila CBS 207.26]|uniref:Uncharacterized protein n=1 Tax=Zopfia rhizophila CBS 207.26 TaxID=1314779 RepID=A0A6A6E2Y2_9PEZI|nr:hypothetical protein K469DRAFT_666626 [Zopfia rhizophila CBS 207.26]